MSDQIIRRECPGNPPPDRDSRASCVAGALWPGRDLGSLSTGQWVWCYSVVDALFGAPDD